MLTVALLLAVLIGISLGMLGGGGSILTLPILMYVLGMDEKTSIATSLVIVGLTSISALVSHARSGNVVWKIGLLFAAAGSVGAFLGGLAADLVPGAWLIRGFLLMMLATGVAMIRGRKEVKVERAEEQGLPFVKIGLEGLVVGVVTGLVGAGGGFLVVPALSLLGGLPMAQAVGTSLLVIAIKSFFGYLGHATHVEIDWGVTLAMSAAAVFGSFGGGLAASKVPANLLRQGFGVFVLVMAVFMGSQQL